MISYEIITQKPPATTPYTGYSNYPNRIVNNRAELDEYLKQNPMARPGLFVVSQYQKNLKINALYQIHCIVAVQTDYNKLSQQTDRGHPKCVFLISCNEQMGLPGWARWDSVTDYVPLDKEAYMRMIHPDHAKLQDYIEKTAANNGITYTF